jgi:hypothetical protein
LVNSSKRTFECAQDLSAKLSNLKLLRQTLKNVDAEWTKPMLERLRNIAPSEILELFEALGGEVETATADRKQFLAKPVVFPDDDDQNDILIDGLRNLGKGKNPFGLAGLVGKGTKKTILASIRVLGIAPRDQIRLAACAQLCAAS